MLKQKFACEYVTKTGEDGRSLAEGFDSRGRLTRDTSRLRRCPIRNAMLAAIGSAALLALAACGPPIPPGGSALGQGICEEDFAHSLDEQLKTNIERGELRAECKHCKTSDPSQCYAWLADPIHCGQLGYANGRLTTPIAELPKDENGKPVLDEHGHIKILAPLGGQNHDSDYQFDFEPLPFPNGIGVQGSGVDGMKRIPFPSQASGTIADIPHVEVPWCRWYGAPVLVDPQGEPVLFGAFRPNTGGRVSVVGDWTIERQVPPGHVEIHEARMLVSVRPDQTGGNCTLDGYLEDQINCLLKDEAGQGTPPVTCEDPTTPGCKHPDTWHLLTSGVFVKGTAQQDELDIVVPIPPARDGAKTKLVWDVPAMKGGCLDTKVQCNIACDADAPDGPSCQIQLLRNGAELSDFKCGGNEVCLCGNRPDFLSGSCWPGTTYKNFNACHPSAPFGQTHIAFARDIRVKWVQPDQPQPTDQLCGGKIAPRSSALTAESAPAAAGSAQKLQPPTTAFVVGTAVGRDDLWACRCSFQDPAQPGATFEAGVFGCAPHGLEDDRTEDIHKACSRVCAGKALIGEGAPAARIGPSLPAGDAEGHRWVANACSGPSPTHRVSFVADYTASLDDSRSLVRVGDIDSQGNFTERARSVVRGRVAFNLTDGTRLELATVQAAPQDFVIGSFLNLSDIHVQRAFSIGLNRAVAQKQGDGTFSLPARQFNLAAKASINQIDNTSLVSNAGPFRLTWDPSLDVLTLDGQGDDGAGHGLVFHLVGRVTNHPPQAVATDQVVECQSPGGAAVVLDANRSTDRDRGDALTHFQWFENGAGLSIAKIVGVQASLGHHEYDLHVYDSSLASGMTTTRVDVVDTTAPAVRCSVATPVLSRPFPPNHNLENIGLSSTASDVCSGPRPVTVKVFGNEDDETPIGDEATVFSPDAADIALGTLRLRAERVASGSGRVYLIVPQATDPSGNKGFACCTVAVPHAKSSASVAAVAAQAAAAKAFCLDNQGTPPPGYFAIGDGPVIGPKQ